MKANQKGFTLVEIAIVLVIIGLLLGGILKGQEMITQAKIKNVIADFSGISAAYYGYQDRYRAIPGDDTGATRWGMTPPARQRHRGGFAYNSATRPTESRLWWEHLRRAGFVAGTGAQQPLNAVVGMMGVQTGDGAPTARALGGLHEPDHVLGEPAGQDCHRRRFADGRRQSRLGARYARTCKPRPIRRSAPLLRPTRKPEPTHT
jgi:prepilin-type N-terminal cleavage/methylation domain-containing protein